MEVEKTRINMFCIAVLVYIHKQTRLKTKKIVCAIVYIGSVVVGSTKIEIFSRVYNMLTINCNKIKCNFVMNISIPTSAKGAF